MLVSRHRSIPGTKNASNLMVGILATFSEYILETQFGSEANGLVGARIQPQPLPLPLLLHGSTGRTTADEDCHHCQSPMSIGSMVGSGLWAGGYQALI